MLIQDQVQTQQQKIDPKVILANNILQLSGVELEQAVEQELAENPALEQEDEEPCTGCEMKPFLCKDCQYSKQKADQEFIVSDQVNQEPEYVFEFNSDPDDQTDPISFIRAELTLPEHLREQLRSTVSGKILEVGDYLVNYIDDNGYFKCDLIELTLELDATDEEIAEALTVIQTLDPPGVGARDLRECMIIQLRYLAEEGHGSPIALRMVQDFWDEIKSRKFNRIARRLKIEPDRVLEAVDFIQTRLSPYPAAGFRSPWDSKPNDVKTAVRADVIIHRTPIGYEIEIVTNEHIALTINPYYRRIYNDLRNGKAKAYTSEDKKHVTEYMERAELFIKNIHNRRRTLKNITRYLVEYEQGFLETGSKLFLRPLTRVKVAKTLGMHESTVSRATANKYVQLPNQEVMPFEFFFQSSHSIGDMVATLIGNEDSAHPLSDQEIADTLTKQGNPVARRTVVKYREARKILSSRQRRR
jgi:RNA polymerase sigma-54 factor